MATESDRIMKRKHNIRDKNVYHYMHGEMDNTLCGVDVRDFWVNTGKELWVTVHPTEVNCPRCSGHGAFALVQLAEEDL